MKVRNLLYSLLFRSDERSLDKLPDYSRIPNLFDSQGRTNITKSYKGKLDGTIFEKQSPSEQNQQEEEENDSKPTTGKLDFGPKPVPVTGGKLPEKEQEDPVEEEKQEEAAPDDSPGKESSQGKLGINVAPTVGGGPAVAGEFPFYAHVVGDVLCGGTLVHSDIVLTSAQCQTAFAVGEARVYIGGIKQNQGNEFYVVDELLPHPAFETSNLHNDIMLVKLSGLSTTAPVTLNANPGAPADDELVRAIGFPDAQSNLEKVDLPTIPFATCDARPTTDLLADTQICAGDLTGGDGPCDTDQGSPLLDPGSKVQYGITSFRDGTCGAADSPSIFTDVAAYIQFIEDGICELSDDRPDDCPSQEPTMSMAPSTSSAPTISSAPSPSPTVSSAPTSMPTMAPTLAPSPQPSQSSTKSGKKSGKGGSKKASGKKTSSGKKSSGKSGKKVGSSNDDPTASPTAAPTTPPPTMAPTLAPTLSLSPTVSMAPSQVPTISLAPSVRPSDAPSAEPTISLVPSSMPSDMPSSVPSISMEPTASSKSGKKSTKSGKKGSSKETPPPKPTASERRRQFNRNRRRRRRKPRTIRKLQ